MTIITAFLIAQAAGTVYALYVSGKGMRMSNLVRTLGPSTAMWMCVMLYLVYEAATNHARINFDPLWAGTLAISNLALYALIGVVSDKLGRKTK